LLGSVTYRVSIGSMSLSLSIPNYTTTNAQVTPNCQLPKLPTAKTPNSQNSQFPKLPIPKTPKLGVGAWALIGSWALCRCGVDTATLIAPPSDDSLKAPLFHALSGHQSAARSSQGWLSHASARC